MVQKRKAPRQHKPPPSTPKEVEQRNIKFRQQNESLAREPRTDLRRKHYPVISITDANELAHLAGVGDSQGGGRLQDWFDEQAGILRRMPAIKKVHRRSQESPRRKTSVTRGAPSTIGHMTKAGVLLANKYKELGGKPIRCAGAFKSWEGRRADSCVKFIAFGLKVFFNEITDSQIMSVFQNIKKIKGKP